MPRSKGTTILKYFDAALSAPWPGLYSMESSSSTSTARIHSFTPKWSDKPLLKSWQKTKPTLGWPRETDSLCPKCVNEAREAIMSGEEDYTILINEKVGEIKATDHRTRRPDLDGQGLSEARQVRRHDGDRLEVPASGSRRTSRAATFRRTTTRTCTTTAQHHQVTAAARF